MPKRKKNKIPPVIFKVVFLSALVIALGVFGAIRIQHLVLHSQYFRIKTIVIDPALHFINKRDLIKYKGENIFTVDIGLIQKRLGQRYPQVSDLRVVRKFPDQLSVMAKKRMPFVQTTIGGKILTLDENAVVLSSASDINNKLPFIKGLDITISHFSLGMPLRGKNVNTAVSILREYELTTVLSTLKVSEINVSNLSKVEMLLSNDLLIILDQDNISRRIAVLGIIITQGQVDIGDVKYIDLRFKEPILGKKT